MPDNAKRIIRDYVQSIPTSADSVFPLLCPEREREWLDGWDYRMCYSESGYAEEGAVFTTREDGRDTVWIITHRDPAAREIRFARVTPDIAATQLAVRVEPVDRIRSRVHIRYTHTSLSAEGDAFLASITAKVFNERMRFWEASMTHYLECRERLSRRQFESAHPGDGAMKPRARQRR